MQTIKQLLYDAVEYDSSLLAHAIFIGVQDGHFSLEEPASAFDFEKLDTEKVIKATKENILAINSVKLFAVPLGTGCFAFILAETQKDAVSEFFRKYEKPPAKLLDMSLQMDRTLYFPEKNKFMNFWEIKSQIQNFPYFVCEFQRDERRQTA